MSGTSAFRAKTFRWEVNSQNGTSTVYDYYIVLFQQYADAYEFAFIMIFFFRLHKSVSSPTQSNIVLYFSSFLVLWEADIGGLLDLRRENILHSIYFVSLTE
jgi:hypothetical protein